MMMITEKDKIRGRGREREWEGRESERASKRTSDSVVLDREKPP